MNISKTKIIIALLLILFSIIWFLMNSKNINNDLKNNKETTNNVEQKIEENVNDSKSVKEVFDEELNKINIQDEEIKNSINDKPLDVLQ